LRPKWSKKKPRASRARMSSRVKPCSVSIQSFSRMMITQLTMSFTMNVLRAKAMMRRKKKKTKAKIKARRVTSRNQILLTPRMLSQQWTRRCSKWMRG
jgi:hypothetical protein